MRNCPYVSEIYLVNVKPMRTIAQIFMAFSEKLNFTYIFLLMHFHDIKHCVIHQCWCSWKPTKNPPETQSFWFPAKRLCILNVIQPYKGQFRAGNILLILPFLPEKLPETCWANGPVSDCSIIDGPQGILRFILYSADYDRLLKADKVALTLASY